jgi:hypothetical protein
MEDIKNLAAALVAASKEIEGVVKDKANPFFKSKYADLSSVAEAIKPALARHGLTFIQKVHPMDGMASVETLILHESGETFSCGATSAPTGKWDKISKAVIPADAQAYTAAITYARRTSLSAAFGICPEDDDGNTACGKKKKEEQVQDFQSEEARMLGASELRKLATRVANTLMDDPSLSCAISEDEMYEWLAHCQKFRQLQPSADELLANDRFSLLNSFTKWQSGKAA